ncbi:MAG TPA: VWA-like domain-containing protein [Thermoanaerobaculia bacterium]|nr:VWA-like domain-containing protein [Thermoanaerobaculia bacterium]
MKATEKLRVATSYLILHHPFIAAPLLRLKLVPEPRQPTAAVDGRSIFYNEDFVTGLSCEGTIFLLAHEVLHVTLAHHLRRGDRNPKAWNAAGDYVINLMLQQAGYTLIPDILLEPLFAGWSTERVYRFLIGKAEQSLAAALSASPASSQGLDDFIPEGAGGSVVDMRTEDGQKLSQAERSQEEGRLLVALKQALQAQAMLRGEASIQPFARCVEPRSPAFDARAELAEFVRSTAGRDDYTWRRPNPRYLPAGVFVPSLAESRALTDVVVAIDTSSSVTPELLSFMAGACDDLLAAYPQTVLQILYCDTEVRSTEEITAFDSPVTLSRAQGGGGTRFAPVFDWVAQQGYQPTFLLYMTDLQGPVPEDPGYPVVWLAIDAVHPTPPFGRRIDLSTLR